MLKNAYNAFLRISYITLFDERRTMSVKILIFYYNMSYFNLKIFKSKKQYVTKLSQILRKFKFIGKLNIKYH
jgi:hypothetical protein